MYRNLRTTKPLEYQATPTVNDTIWPLLMIVIIEVYLPFPPLPNGRLILDLVVLA